MLAPRKRAPRRLQVPEATLCVSPFPLRPLLSIFDPPRYLALQKDHRKRRRPRLSSTNRRRTPSRPRTKQPPAHSSTPRRFHEAKHMASGALEGAGEAARPYLPATVVGTLEGAGIMSGTRASQPSVSPLAPPTADSHSPQREAPPARAHSQASPSIAGDELRGQRGRGRLAPGHELGGGRRQAPRGART